MLQKDILNVIGHGTVFLCCQLSDVIKDLFRQAKRKYAFIGSRTFPPLFLL